jgi:hypothetical protein
MTFVTGQKMLRTPIKVYATLRMKESCGMIDINSCEALCWYFTETVFHAFLSTTLQRYCKL